MKKYIQLLSIILSTLLIFSLHSKISYAEQVNQSVKECLEHPENCEDQTKTPSSTFKETKNETKVGITSWDIIKTIGSLLFVLLLLFSFLKWLQKKNSHVPSSQFIKNLGGTNLSMNRSVQLVKVGNSIFILGVGENVQLLKEITDEKEVEEILQRYQEQFVSSIDAKDLLTKWLHPWKQKNNQKDEQSSFSHIFQQTLLEITKRRKEVLQDDEEKGFKNK